METYKAVEGSHITDADAEVYGKRIAQLRVDNTWVTPEIVLEDARSTKSPLHDYFEWDNNEAAAKWRLAQAGQLMRSINVIVLKDDKPELIRAFFNVTATESMDTESRKVYISQKTAFSNAERRAEVIAYALRELKGWRERYNQYSELAELSNEIGRFIDKK